MTETRSGPGAAISRAFVEEITQRWYDAWNSHDADRAIACLADDIVYDFSGWPTTMHGHTQVRACIEATWRAFPNLHLKLVGGPYLDPDGPRSACYWRGSATHEGLLDPPGLAPTGRRIALEGAELYEFRDGMIVRLRDIWDSGDVARQLGVSPATGSRAERFTMALANLGTRIRRLAR
jgi:steroid delta-isomerase-like uncharacterized protein